MKQAVMTSPGVIEFRDVPVPKPGPEEVLIRVRRIGVCGSDVHVRHGRHPFTSYPVVQGHEFSGVIEAVGKRVPGLRPGQKVTATPQDRLRPLRPLPARGLPHLRRPPGPGLPGAGMRPGVLPGPGRARSSPFPPPSLSNRGPWSSRRPWASTPSARAGTMAGTNVAVLGAGPIGNLVGQVARAAGAKVLMTDISEFRLEIARKCGLRSVSLAGRETLKDASARVFGAKGFQTAFECAGVEAAINEAIDAIQKGGTIVAVGVYGDRPRVNMGFVQDRELTIIGTLMYQQRDFVKAVRLMKSGRRGHRAARDHPFPLRASTGPPTTSSTGEADEIDEGLHRPRDRAGSGAHTMKTIPILPADGDPFRRGPVRRAGAPSRPVSGAGALIVSVPEEPCFPALFARAKARLAKAGLAVAHFDGVVPNPTTDVITPGRAGRPALQGRRRPGGSGGGSSHGHGQGHRRRSDATPGRCWDYLFFRRDPAHGEDPARRGRDDDVGHGLPRDPGGRRHEPRREEQVGPLPCRSSIPGSASSTRSSC